MQTVVTIGKNVIIFKVRITVTFGGEGRKLRLRWGTEDFWVTTKFYFFTWVAISSVLAL